MYQDSLYEYLRKLHAHLEKQNKKLKELDLEVKELKHNVAAIKDKPINIEKIEYKFDQLKVETLEGTLNIGITPNGSNIEDFAVNEADHIVENTSNQYNGVITEVQREINHFLDHDARQEIKSIGRKHNYELDESYYHLIVEDIKKQIDQRIQIYVNQINKKQGEQSLEQSKDEIIKKVKKDIVDSIESFVQHLPRKEQ